MRTDALLKPVSSTSAAATAREVSAAISRINSGHMATPSLSRTPSEASAAAGARRSVTDGARAPDGSREPSRRFSQPALRNSYHAAEAGGVDYSAGAPVVGRGAGRAQRSRTPTPTDAGGRPRRPSSGLGDRLSSRMSWLRELEESSGRAATGRDYVFGKLQGGVAAKLAALEHKGVAAVAAPADAARAGRCRGPSRARATSAPARRTASRPRPSCARRAAAAEKAPGSIAGVVDDGFKRRLEGSLKAAQEQQEKAAAQGKPADPAAGSRVARMAAARRRVPGDVLELIALSGVDEEVAINEYLQHGNLGRTRTWDHEEVMRQVAAEAGPLAGKAEKAEGKTEAKTEPKVEEKVEATAEEKPTVPEVKAEEKPAVPDARGREAVQEAGRGAEEKDEQPAVAVAVEEPAAEAALATEEAVKVEQPAVPEPKQAQPAGSDGEVFNAAALPALA